MPKERNHNEWFQPLSTKRKSCPTCHHHLDDGEMPYAWGEHVRGKWRTVLHFCKWCFAHRVQSRLTDHAADCGCTITLCARSGYGPLPAWLRLSPEPCEVPT